MNQTLKKIFLTILISHFLITISAWPQNLSDVTDEDMEEINKPVEVTDDASVEEAAESEVAENQPSAEDIERDSELEEQLEEMIEEDENDDYYDDDYGWTDSFMNPIRNVGQSISNTVNAGASMVNNGANVANDWWNGSGDDYDDYFENYDDANDQVNAWWDAHIEEEYEYDEEDEEEIIAEKSAAASGQVSSENEADMEDMDDDYDGYDEDMYDYYDLYSAMRYPKPEDSKVEASQIHHPKDNRVQLQRMRSRAEIPYSVDDYFDFVVIAMCVVLLFIMLMAGVSRFQNQRYLKKTYGRKAKEGEKRPLID